MLLFLSCTPDDVPCSGTTSLVWSGGEGFCSSNYGEFTFEAIYARSRVSDTLNGGWVHTNEEVGVILTVIENCITTVQISMGELALSSIGDTIFLQHFDSTNSPRVRLHYVDDDVVLEFFDVLAGSEMNCWVLLDSLSGIGSSLFGRFQLDIRRTQTGVSSDPGRPDTLYFRNGQFRADFAPF